MKSPFKWGIIGPGRIAEKFANAVKKTPGTAVYAAASRSASDPDKIKHQFHAEKFYPTYEELAADSQVDAIYISTPHPFHYENIKLCLQANKPVLCEKPMTVNAKQADELFKLSKSRNIFLMEALWTRFLPIYEQVRKWIDTGKIGDIRLVNSNFGFAAPRDFQDRLLNKDLAGGSLLDIGVYNISITQWIYKLYPETVQAVGYLGETGVDETVSATLLYKNGAAAQFTCTIQTPTNNNLTITGMKGRITIYPQFYNAEEAVLESNGRSKIVRKRHRVNGFEYQIKAAIKAIRSGKLDCPQNPQADSLISLKVMDKIREQIGLRYPFE